MPIDPVTAKIIAQLAIKTITDEESRNKIVVAVIAPIIIVLIILSMSLSNADLWQRIPISWHIFYYFFLQPNFG